MTEEFISRAQTEYVAKLAHLSFSDTELTEMQQSMGSILGYMQELQRIDTTAVAPTTHVLPLVNVFREDEIGACLPLEKTLANAPDQLYDSFKVPKIL